MVEHTPGYMRKRMKKEKGSSEHCSAVATALSMDDALRMATATVSAAAVKPYLPSTSEN